MPVESHQFSIDSNGNTHVINLSDDVSRCLSRGKIKSGIATLFVVGSTAAITTTEYEPGLVHTDLKNAYERIAPEDAYYGHEETWNDDNGHSHVRATVTGPALTVPLIDGQLTLGIWQQIILLDFDTRQRRREILIQIVGE